MIRQCDVIVRHRRAGLSYGPCVCVLCGPAPIRQWGCEVCLAIDDVGGPTVDELAATQRKFHYHAY